MARVNLNDFNGETFLNKMKSAIDFCKQNPKTILFIPAGEYIISDKSAVKLMNDAMNGLLGNNPQEHIFTHNHHYFRALDFSGCVDLSVEAYGVRILCDGWMEALAVENSENIEIKGFTIDYLRKPYSVGSVINDASDYYDVEFEPKFPVTENLPSSRIFSYCEESRLLGNDGWDCEKKELIANQTIRFYGEKPERIIGKKLVVWHCFHYRPAIFINASKKVTFQDVTINSQAGMGIVGHRSEDISFEKLRIVPEAGELMSTNTDATHFTSCKGSLIFNNCQFEGHGDDATNVHNYYYSLYHAKNNICEIAVDEAADAHAQVLDYPDIKDVLELVEKESLMTVDSFVVEEVTTFKKEWKSLIRLDKDLPENYEKYFLVNVTRLPKLRFMGCHVRNHLARAVLIKTHDVLVEGCTFESSLGTAIHIAAEGSWREGIPSKNVVIRGNRMIKCGRGNTKGKRMDAAGICINIEAKEQGQPLHQNILIENNIIVGENSAQGIFVSSAKDVIIRNNQFSGCEKAVDVFNSSNVIIENNFE